MAMKTTRIGGVRQADTSLWPIARRVGSVIAYAGVPASTLTTLPGVLTTVNVLTSFYLVAIFGVVGALRGARVQPGLVTLSYFLVAWYVVLLAIELIHGGPFHYPFTRGANFLTDYFPLVALPFFAIGLREAKAEFRVFEYVMMGTIVFSAGLSLYQFFILDIQRPNGFSRNPIPFALVLTMWSLFLFSGALKARKIDWTRFSIALIALIPIILSGSKNIWFCAAAGYSLLFFMWAWTGRRWSILGAVAVGIAPSVWLLLRVDVVRSRITEFMGDYGAFLASGDTSGGSFGLRYGALVSGFLAFLDRPFLGYGLAQGKSAAIEHLPPSFSSIGMLTHLHNEYVTHLVAFGTLGLFFIVSFFAMFILIATRREDVAIRRFGVVAGTLFLFYMTADVVFTLPEVYGLVFFLLGLMLLAPEKKQQIEGAPGLMRRLRAALPLVGSAGGRSSVERL